MFHSCIKQDKRDTVAAQGESECISSRDLRRRVSGR